MKEKTKWIERTSTPIIVVLTLLGGAAFWALSNVQVGGVSLMLWPVIAFFVLGVPIWLIGAWHGQDGYQDDGRDSWTTRF